MPLPFMGCGGGMASLPDALSAMAWDNVSVAHPATSGSTSDIAVSAFKVGANRYIKATKTGSVGRLYYRLDSGSWVLHQIGAGTGTPFAVTPGQTIGWKVDDFGGTAGNGGVTVRDDARGDILDTFTYTYTGTP